MNLTKQFYATLLNQDDQSMNGEEEQPPCLMVSPLLKQCKLLRMSVVTVAVIRCGVCSYYQECLFQFLRQRYQIDNIAPRVTFDFLSSLSLYHSQNKVCICSLCTYVCCVTQQSWRQGYWNTNLYCMLLEYKPLCMCVHVASKLKTSCYLSSSSMVSDLMVLLFHGI